MAARCPMCGTTGWILDHRTDKPGPLMLELIECLIPDCPWAGRPIRGLSFKGPRFTHASQHPRTGVVMSVTA